MKALVFEGPGAMKVKDMPEPRLRPREVMVRPLVTAVCLTDVASYDGWYTIPATHPDSYPSELPGIIIGHESSAQIIEVGPDVTDWSVGDRVAIDPTVFCQHCEMCKVGLYEACTTIDAPKQALGINSQNPDGSPRYHGLFAEYAAVPIEMMYRVPDAVSATAAASIEVLGIAYTRLRAANARIGDDVVVFGAAFDYLVLAQLAALSAANVIVIDPYAVRRSVARKYFEHVVDPTTIDVVDYVHSVMPAGAERHIHRRGHAGFGGGGHSHPRHDVCGARRFLAAPPRGSRTDQATTCAARISSALDPARPTHRDSLP